MDPLIASARDGSETAAQQLMERFAPDVQAYIRRHVGTALARKVSTADLCQDAFVRVFATLDSLPDDADLDLFKARLMRHAQWSILDAARALKHLTGESSAGDTPHENLADPLGDASMGDVTRDDQAAWLERLMAKLGPSYADVLRLRMEGDAFATIGERLGISEATARKRYERAARQLRDLIDLATPDDRAARS